MLSLCSFEESILECTVNRDGREEVNTEIRNHYLLVTVLN